MGCGDTFADIATGGVTAAVRGDLAGAATMGATTALGDGEIGQLARSTATSLLTGGYNNFQAAAKKKNFANQADAFFDPSRVNDKWIRASGELMEEVPLGHDARKIAPQVMATVGGIYGGPVGSMAGYYMGNKIKGGTDDAGLKGGAISAAGTVAGGVAGTYVGPAVSSAVGQGVAGNIAGGAASGAVGGAASGALGAAATGQDIGAGAGRGAIGGAIGGGANASLNSIYAATGTPQYARTGLSSLANQGIKYGVNEINQAAFPNQNRPQPQQFRPQQKQLTTQQQQTMNLLMGRQ